MTTHPGTKFSVNKFDFDQDSGAINQWVIDFLSQNENPNTELASILADTPMLWAGPIEIELDRLVRVGGPGMEYDEEPEIWEARINAIASSISDIRDLPPLIVLAKVRGDEQGLNLIVADGAHRLGAVHALGRPKVWVLIAFYSEQLRDKHLPAISRHHFEQISGKPMSNKEIANPYIGNAATNYDAVRKEQPHWHTEHQAVSQLMQRHKGKTVLDAPVGTGRFMGLYQELDCSVIALDLSADMLAITGKKASAAGMTNVKLVKGSAADESSEVADVSLCVRFINLIPGEVAEQVVKHLGKASREEMLIHLTSTDFNEVPPSEHRNVDIDMARRYERQREQLEFAPHKLSDFLRWSARAGFEVAESIECQEKNGYSRTHIHRLVRA